MREQGHLEKTGTAKITPAYCLPSRFVLHTVGPICQIKVQLFLIETNSLNIITTSV
jgi:O-acetyl-ADP-ribose deacetylase (regulator of RNase III)